MAKSLKLKALVPKFVASLGMRRRQQPRLPTAPPSPFFAMHEIRLRCEIKAGADSNLRHVSILEFKAPSHFCWGSCRTEAQQVLLQSLRNNCMPTEDNHAEPTRQIQAEPVANRVCKAQHRRSVFCRSWPELDCLGLTWASARPIFLLQGQEPWVTARKPTNR